MALELTNNVNIKDPFNLSKFANTAGTQVAQAGQQALQTGAQAGAQAQGGASALGGQNGMFNNITAGVGAATNLLSLGFGIADSIQKNKLAKEQQDMAKKNFNLELEKQQKAELQDNKLAATIDAAWGGDGKIDSTIDYGKYAATQGDASNIFSAKDQIDAQLSANQNANTFTGQNDQGYINKGSNVSSASGDTPIASQPSNLTPVGYSESVDSQQTEEETK